MPPRYTEISILDCYANWSREKMHRALKDLKVGVSYRSASKEVKDQVANGFRSAIKRGQIIELGEMEYRPSKKAATLGVNLIMKAGFKSPFRTPWLISSDLSFVNGQEPSSNMVLVDPVSDELWRYSEFTLTKTGVFLAWYTVELNPMTGTVTPLGDYALEMGINADMGRVGGTEYANSANTIFAAIAILNTRGVYWKSTPTLVDRKGRVTKVGTHVSNGEYFTALRERTVKTASAPGAGQIIGERKRPCPHIRRGHLRHYADGRKPKWIYDMLINVKTEGEPSFFERLAYKAPKGILVH